MSDSTRAQEHRRDNQDIIIPLLHEYTPNFPTVIANKIAFQLHMSPWTIRYNYLPMFEDAGLLIKLEN